MVWYKQFTNELYDSIRQLQKTLFSDETIEYYLQDMVKKEEEIKSIALANV